MAKQTTAMQRLLSEGFFDCKEDALPYLMSGAVFCASTPVKTGGQKIALDLPLTVAGLYDRYVSKGGYKLEGALLDFGIDASDRICIDAGACTGGFTDCLIKHGAQKVYAVEVGFGQLQGSLMQNPKVQNLEKTNLGDEILLSLTPPPTLGSVDLSYLSLRKAVPLYREIMQHQGELCCLVKPLFETDDATARRTGVLSSDAYEPLLLSLIDDLNQQAHTRVQNITHSPVTGNHGTVEFFLHVVFGDFSDAPPVLSERVTQVVQTVLTLPIFKK